MLDRKKDLAYNTPYKLFLRQLVLFTLIIHLLQFSISIGWILKVGGDFNPDVVVSIQVKDTICNVSFNHKKNRKK